MLFRLQVRLGLCLPIALLVGAGCGADRPVVESTIVLSRTNEAPCLATIRGQRRPANRLVFEVYRLTGSDGVTQEPRRACEACSIGDPATPCTLEQSHCLCPGETETRIESLRRTASGLRAQDLMPGVYCARMVVLEMRGGDATTPTGTCSCDGVLMQRNTIRACGLSLPHSIGHEDEAAAIQLPMRCYDDPEPPAERDFASCPRASEPL